MILSFGFIDRSLAQNVVDSQFQANKIKISADNAPVPEYLKHSKQAQKNIVEQKKAPTSSIIGKMLKALFLAIALFLGLIAVFVKNKDKFKGNQQPPISLSKVIKQDEPKIETATEIKAPEPIKPEVLNGDAKIKNLVFNFFKLNK